MIGIQKRLAVKILSLVITLTFLSWQIAWAAGGYVGLPTDNDKNQSGFLSSQELQKAQARQEALIQRLQDFLDRKLSEGDEENEEEWHVQRKVSSGSQTSGSSSQSGGQTAATDGSTISVITDSGDVIHYRGSKISKVELSDGTIIEDLELDTEGNIVSALIKYPDTSVLAVEDEKPAYLIYPDGTVIQYDADGRVEFMVAPDGAVSSYAYEFDGGGAITKTIVTGPDAIIEYGPDGRLDLATKDDGSVIDYTGGIISSMTMPDGGEYIFEETALAAGIKASLVKYIGSDGAEYLDLANGAIFGVDKIPFTTVLYDETGAIEEVLKANGDKVTYQDGLLESVLVGSDTTLYTYNISDLNNIQEIAIDRLGIKRIHDRYGNLQSLTLDDMTKIVYENGAVSYIEKADGTKIKNITFSGTGDLYGGLISYPDGTVAVYSDGELLNIINSAGDTIDYSDGKIRTVTLEDGSIYDWYYEGSQIKIFDRANDEYRWYLQGQLQKVEELYGAKLTTSYYYDAENNLIKSTISKGADDLYTYTYTYEDGLTLIHDEAGNTQAFTRDKKLSYIIDSKGRKYSYTYVDKDEDNSSVEVTMPDGSVVKYKDVATEIARADGTIIKDIIYDTDLTIISFTYIKDGMAYYIANDTLIKAVKSDGTVLEYYASGWVKSITSPSGEVTEYEYGIADSASLGLGDIGQDLTLTENNGEQVVKLSSHLDPSLSLLLNLNGNDGDTSTSDVSSNNHTVNFNGNAHLDADSRHFGSSSVKFDGNGDYLSIADSDALDFGSGDFTVDFWMKMDSFTTSQAGIIGQFSVSPVTNSAWVVRYNAENGARTIRFLYSTTGSNWIRAEFSWAPGLGDWNHVAFARQGSALRLFINGTQVGSDYNIGSASIHNSSLPFIIGSEQNWTGASGFFNGQLDEIRLTKGVARWTSDFTPPQSESNGTVVNSPSASFTSGAVEINATELNTLSWAESLPEGTDITFQVRAGNSADPDDGTWSAWSASLTDPDGSTLDTAEAKYIQYNVTLSTNDPTVSPGLIFGDAQGVVLRYIRDPKTIQDSGQLARVKATLGSTVKYYDAKGVNVSDAQDTITIADFLKPAGLITAEEIVSQDLLYLGRPIEITKGDDTSIKDIVFDKDNKAKSFTYIKDSVTYIIKDYALFQVIKDDGTIIDYYAGGWVKSITSASGEVTEYEYGIADSTSLGVEGAGEDFTIIENNGEQAVKLSSHLDPDLSLLLNLNGDNNSVFTTDTSNKNYPVSFYGNAHIDTTSKKFGASSLALDGNGDYLTLPDSDNWNFGSGDLTIDYWVSFDSLTGEYGIAGQYNNGWYQWALKMDPSRGGISLFNVTADVATVNIGSRGYAFNENQWYHIALVRDNGNWAIYINGVSQALTTNKNGAFYNCSSPLTIGNAQGSLYLNGSLDGFRISKGIARRTHDFTPSSVEYDGRVVNTPTASFTSGAIEIDATELNTLSWAESLPEGTDITFQVRTGNSADPDDGTWSAWSASLTDPDGSTLDTAEAKYIQYNVTFSTTDDEVTPSLISDGIYANYIRNTQDAQDVDGFAYVKVTQNGVTTAYNSYDLTDLVFDSGVLSKMREDASRYVLNESRKALYFEDDVIIAELTAITKVDNTTTQYKLGEISEIITQDESLVKDIVYNENQTIKSFSYVKNGVTYLIEDDVLVRAIRPDGAVMEYHPKGWVKSITSASGEVTEYEYGIADSASLGLGDIRENLELIENNGEQIVQLSSHLDSSLSLLLHLNGDDNAQSSTDASSNSHPITFHGNAHLDTASKKFGSSSVAFDGTGDYLTIPPSDDWNFGSGDFTIDFSVNFDTISGSRQLIGQGDIGGGMASNDSWMITWGYAARNALGFEFGPSNTRVAFSWIPTVDTWYNISIVREGTTLKAYVDGAQVGSTYIIGTAAINNSSRNLYVGAGLDAGVARGCLDGWIDELRISKGVARHSSNYTPSPGEYTDRVVNSPSASFTSGAIEIDATELNTLSWAESLPEGTDITFQVRTGNSADPDDGTWSAWSSPLTDPEGSDLNAGEVQYIQYKATLSTANSTISPQLILNDTSAVTIDYARTPDDIKDIENNLSHVKTIRGTAVNYYNSNGINIDNPQDLIDLTTLIAPPEIPSADELSANELKYLGKPAGTTQYEGTIIKNITFDENNNPQDFTFIKYDTTYVIEDYKLAKVKSSDGTIIEYHPSGWIKSITSPDGKVTEYEYGIAKTASLAPANNINENLELIHNGSEMIVQLSSHFDQSLALLLNLNGANGATAASDTSSHTHPVVLHGNAHLDTEYKQFGASSLALDGSGDYVTLTDSADWDFGTGDFTLDFWVRINDWNAANVFMSSTNWGASSEGYMIMLSRGGVSFLATSGNGGWDRADFGGASPFSLNTWSHIALVRNNGSLTLYADGSSIATISNPNTINSSGTISIGYGNTASSYINGWLDEIRISKAARWTQDFTPSAYEYNGYLVDASTASFRSDPIELNATELKTLSWNEAIPQGTDITFQIRTGDTSNPDDGTWSDWSAPFSNPDGSQINIGKAKYIQYKATLTADDTTVTPQLILNDTQGIDIDYTSASINPGNAGDVVYVKAAKEGVTTTYDKNGVNIDNLLDKIDIAKFKHDSVYVDELNKDIINHQLNGSQKIITVYKKGSNSPIKTITADQTITYYDDGYAARVEDKNGTLLVEYAYDEDKNLLKTEFVEARKKLEEGYQASLQNIATQREEALARLDQAEIDARNNIIKEVAKIQSQIDAERVRLRQEKAKYDPNVYDLSAFDAAFRDLDTYQSNLDAQEAQAYVDLENQITKARQDIEDDAAAAMVNLLENDYKVVLGDICQKESSPVVYFYYRNVLGRDPDETELEYWLDKAKSDLLPIGPDEITQYLKDLPEYTQRQTWKRNIIDGITAFFTSYLAATDTEKEAMLSTLGLTPDDVSDITLTQEDIDTILPWLEGQSLHFGDSAFKTIIELLQKEGITKTFEDIGKDAIKVDILTGVINKDTKGDLVISMYAMEKFAETNGLNLFAERIDFDELKSQRALNDSIILHITGDHYVLLADINEDDQTVTYKDLSVGEHGQEIEVSRAEFMELWGGYVLSKNQIQNTANDKLKYLNESQERNIRGAGWWKRFWKGVVNFFQKVVAPIAVVLLLIPGPTQAIGAIMLGINIMVQTISAAVRTSNWNDVLWAVGTTFAAAAFATVMPTVFDGVSTAFKGLSSTIFAPLQGVFNVVMPIFQPIVWAVEGISIGLNSVFNPILGEAIAASLTTNIIGTAVNLGASFVFESMKLDPTLNTIGSAILSGLSMGMVSSDFTPITGAFQSGTLAGVEEIGKAADLDPNVTRLAAMTAGAMIGGSITAGGDQIAYDKIMESLAYNVISETAYMGVTEVGEILGIDPRISYLAGIGIRSSLQAGLGTYGAGGLPADIAQSAFQAALLGATRGALNLGIEYVGQKFDIDPLYTALIARVSAGALEGLVTPIDPNNPDGAKQGILRGIIEGIFDSGKNALVLGGSAYGNDAWSRSAYIAQVLDISRSIKENGLAETLENYAAGILQQDAIESILRTGVSIKGYIERKQQANEVEQITIKDGESAELLELDPEGENYLIYSENASGEEDLRAIKGKNRYVEADVDANGKADWTKITETIENPDGSFTVTRKKGGKVVRSTVIASDGKTTTMYEEEGFPLEIIKGAEGSIIKSGVMRDEAEGVTFYFKDGKLVKDKLPMDTFAAEQDEYGNITIDGLTDTDGNAINYKERIYNPDGTISEVRTIREDLLEVVRARITDPDEKAKLIENINKQFGDPLQPPNDYFHLGGMAAPGSGFATYSIQVQYNGIAGVTPEGGLMLLGVVNPGTSVQAIVKGYSSDNDSERRGFWSKLKDKFFKKKIYSRYMSKREFEEFQRTGKIPNKDVRGRPKHIRFTDYQTSSKKEAYDKLQLDPKDSYDYRVDFSPKDATNASEFTKISGNEQWGLGGKNEAFADSVNPSKFRAIKLQ